MNGLLEYPTHHYAQVATAHTGTAPGKKLLRMVKMMLRIGIDAYKISVGQKPEFDRRCELEIEGEFITITSNDEEYPVICVSFIKADLLKALELLNKGITNG